MMDDKKLNVDLKDYPDIYNKILESSELQLENNKNIKNYHDTQKIYQNKLLSLYAANIIVSGVIFLSLAVIFWIKL